MSTTITENWARVAATTAILCCLHVSLEAVLSRMPKIQRRAGVLSYNLSACAILSVLAYYGVPEYINGSYTDNLMTRYPVTQHLGELMLGYQIYNMAIAFLYTPLRTTVNFVHHTAAMISAYFVVKGLLHGYIAYSYGVFESSSIILCFIDIFKLFPTLVTTFPSAYTALRMSFALMFLWVRIVLIIPFVWLFTTDLYRAINSGTLSRSQTSTLIVLYMCCLSLSTLQFVWGRVIVQGLLKAVGLGGGKRKAKAEPAPEPELKTKEPKLRRVRSFTDAVEQLQDTVEQLAESMEVADLDVNPLDPLNSVPSPQIS